MLGVDWTRGGGGIRRMKLSRRNVIFAKAVSLPWDLDEERRSAQGESKADSLLKASNSSSFKAS